MAALDWSQCPAVESVPGKVSGAWVFRGTRMPVATVFAGLEEGMTIKELVETYDGLTREHVEAVLEFAARSPETPAPAQQCASYSIKEPLYKFARRYNNIPSRQQERQDGVP